MSRHRYTYMGKGYRIKKGKRRRGKRRSRHQADSAKARKPIAPPGRKCVYIVGNPEYKLAKIGYSQDCWRRVQRLQQQAPFPLYVYTVHEFQGREAEKKLHERFRLQRSRGEWFVIEGELAEYLGRYEPVEAVFYFFDVDRR